MTGAYFVYSKRFGRMQLANRAGCPFFSEYSD
jgi:hypothetical protein